MNKIYLILLSFLLIISSCTTITSSGAKPKSGYAYLYGRFNQSGVRHGSVDMGIENTKTKRTYRIILGNPSIFRTTPAVYAVAVKPGTYAFSYVGSSISTSAGYTANNGKLEWSGGSTQYATREFPYAEYRVPFTVEAGKRYYLGDFSGSVSGSYSRGWGIGEPVQNYFETKAEFDELYLHLTELPSKAIFQNERKYEIIENLTRLWDEDEEELIPLYDPYYEMIRKYLEAQGSEFDIFFSDGFWNENRKSRETLKDGSDTNR